MEQGEVVAGRYELDEPLGSGGMSWVWCATDRRLGRSVAIKFIKPEFSEDPEFLVRFITEAQAVARINHHNVVKVLDFGRHDDRSYLAMEYVGGGALSDITGTPMLPDRALEIVEAAARGAAAAHATGLVHRDIKPANILIDSSGNPKLADFGIATLAGSENLTDTGQAIGSPHYISPEQVSGRQATPASDVYSLGIVLYELLCGRRPFDSEGVTAIAIAHVEKNPEPPSHFVEDLDENLDALVLRSLAKDPADRFADGGELADAIASRDYSMSDDAATSDLTPVQEQSTRPLGRRAAVAALASLLVLGTLWIGYSFMGADESAVSAPRPMATRTPKPDEKRTKPRVTPSATESAPVAGSTATPDEGGEQAGGSEDGGESNEEGGTTPVTPGPSTTPTLEPSATTTPDPTSTP